MAVNRGCFGIVEVGGTPSAVAEVRNWEIESNADVLDASVINNNCAKSKEVGAVEWSGSINCFYDESDTNGQEILTVGAEVAFQVGPNGNSTGDPRFSGTAIVQSVRRSGGADGLVERNFSFVGKGVLTEDTYP